MAFLMTALMVVAFVNVVLLLIVILVGLRGRACRLEQVHREAQCMEGEAPGDRALRPLGARSYRCVRRPRGVLCRLLLDLALRVC